MTEIRTGNRNLQIMQPQALCLQWCHVWFCYVSIALNGLEIVEGLFVILFFLLGILTYDGLYSYISHCKNGSSQHSYRQYFHFSFAHVYQSVVRMKHCI